MINSLGASGGAEHGLVREITNFSSDVGHLVVRLFAKDQLDVALSAADIPVVWLGLDSSRAGWNWPLAARRLLAVIEGFDPDVIHSSLFAANLVAQMAGRRASLPVLSTFTLSGDETLLRNFQPGAASIRGSVLRRIAAMAARSDLVNFRSLTWDALHTNCRLLGIDPSRACVIPRGVPGDLRPVKTKEREELGVPDNVPLLVNVGRQTAQKGHLALLEAFDEVRRSRKAHLVIIGREGEMTPEVNRAIEQSNLGSCVTLTGYTPDVFHYLDHASLFVFSSFMEGLGTSVLEALSFGLPVVAFDIPPVREATDGGRLARLIRPGDITGLAKEIIMVLDERPEKDQRTVEWVSDNYRIETVSARVEALLRKLAAQHG